MILAVGDQTFRFFSAIGACVLFAVDVFRAFLREGIRLPLFIEQMYLAGVRSLPTTMVSGAFVGAIMAIQLDLQLKDFGAQSFLGGLCTSTTIRDIGPVLIAFILSGKVGAFTSAELGTMKVTDQVDAIRCLGTDPISYLILPRMCAVITSSFLLLVIGLGMTVIGGVFISVVQLGINPDAYLNNISKVVQWWSIGMGVVKSFVFGIIIAVICCYEGYSATGGAEGVGKAVKRTSVITLLTIIITNFLISSVSALVYEMLEAGNL